MNNYVVYHLHTDYSLLDSTTKFTAYIDRAAELGQRAICITEHGNLYNWVLKKLYCEQKGVRYLHGVEAYLTESHREKVRDNFHTILIAKNYDGVLELNRAVSPTTDEAHTYYKPRLSFDEFLSLSHNIIKISACLASPLSRLPVTHPRYMELAEAYDYFEIQPHANSREQVQYNRHLAALSAKLGVPLIAGTDTHSLDNYKAECRSVLQLAKHIEFSNEDEFDLTYRTYGELVQEFKRQDAIPEELYLAAIENTNKMADSVEDFTLDTAFKYPKLYGKRDEDVFHQRVSSMYTEKRNRGIIPAEQSAGFETALREECRVFSKIGMSGFMLFMSELVCWCREHNIPVGFNRGSCGGSRVAYVTGITDLNPETWKTVFSRFANEDRKEIGDIDIDVPPSDRDKVYDYIISRFGQENTAYILSFGTACSKDAIDEIGRALAIRWERAHLADVSGLQAELEKMRRENNRQAVRTLTARLKEVKAQNAKTALKNPYSLDIIAQVKKQFEADEAAAREKWEDIFYYYDGILNTVVSQSMHAAGIVASPVTLADHYGTFINDGKTILQIDMDAVHEVSLVKYDILGLKNIEIIKDACALSNLPYPKSHEIDWNDAAVWKDMLRCPVGIFQFEGEYAFSLLRRFQPQNIFDMSLVTAALRPSGASYRDDLMQRKPHHNPSPIIDELLSDNNGYLIYQEDVIKFLQQICGFSGSEADNTRRAIARKDEERLKKALPQILEGYCKTSNQPREQAEREAREFLRVIEDASSYMFGLNHSIGYCMIGYLCAYLRCYHPYEFITAYFNNASGENDIAGGSDLAAVYGIRIVPPRYGLSKDVYVFDREKRHIAKGAASIKYMNRSAANELYGLSKKYCAQSFMELLLLITQETSVNTRQLDILIKLGYFADYGTAPELLRIRDIFSYFKCGEAKKLAKDKAAGQWFEPILKDCATDKTKDGKEAKSYTITNMLMLLLACEEQIRLLHIPDFTLKMKIACQLDYQGYVDLTTANKEDRRLLLVTGVKPLQSKHTGEIWGYAVFTRSIGTGRQARLTVRAGVYQSDPLRKLDIVYAKSVTQHKSGFWYLSDYEKRM